MESRSPEADAADGIISHDHALELLFDSILDRFASLDVFSPPTCPIIFVVYAHDNPQEGEAKAEVVRRIIHWLERSRCRVVSDKAPLGQFPGPQEDTTTVRNILDSQFRLLPRFASGSQSRINVSVDKVIVCGSEVLERYARDDFTASFIEAVKEAYKRPSHAKDNIRLLVEANTQMEGFHHVLTELAFLEIRRLGDRSDHGIIPLALSGKLPGTYLPFVEKCDVFLKKEQSTHLSEQHQLFFKLLAQIYTHSHVEIHQFGSCYENAVKDIKKEGSVNANTAKRIIMSRLHSASRALLDHVTAAARVAGTAREEVDHKREARRVKVMGTLSPLPYQDRKDRNQVREKGTCVWATTHPRFEGWQHSSEASLLWISADPGCGKSVLARSLIDEVLPTSVASTTCYFFFKDDFDDQRSIGNALRCVLHQLFSQKPFLLSDKILDKFRADGQLLSSARGLWDVLLEATCQENTGRVVCILDALDECEENGRKFLGQHLTEFYLKPESRASLKFVITSRPYLDIERGFRLLEHRMPTIRLAGENDAEAQQIEKEIDIVIKARAKQLKAIVRLSDDGYQVLLQGLTRVPNRTYLWATLTFDVVRTAIKTSRDDLEVILRELSRSVDDAYERILSRNQGMAGMSARAILKIIIAATRPLSLLEMSQALALEESAVPQKTVQYQNEDDFRRTIRHLCGLFVTICDSKIYLLHQTARVFLLRKPQSTSDPLLSQQRYQWRQSLFLRDCHCLLTQLCLDCLLFQTSRFDAFARYAANEWNWAFHLRAAGSTTPTQNMFLQARKVCDAKYLATTRHESKSKPLDNLYIFDWGNESDPRADSLTVLMIASGLGLKGVVQSLLNEKKTDIQAVDDKYGQSALFWACIAGRTDVVQTLLDRMSWIASWRALRKRDSNDKTPLLLAIRNNHQATVRLLLNRGAQVTARCRKRSTPLHLAVKKELVGIIQLLLDRGANVNAANKRGWTPLFYAVRWSSEAVILLLLDRGAHINATDMHGKTPLHVVANDWIRPNQGVVQLLLDRGAQINATDKHGTTPLHEAGHSEAVVRLLLKRGAYASARNTNGQTPLYLAESPNIIRALFKAGAQPNVQDSFGRTPLHHAALGETGESSVRLLLEWGASLEIRDNEGETPMDFFVGERDAIYSGGELSLGEKARVNRIERSLAVLRN